MRSFKQKHFRQVVNRVFVDFWVTPSSHASDGAISDCVALTALIDSLFSYTVDRGALFYAPVAAVGWRVLIRFYFWNVIQLIFWQVYQLLHSHVQFLVVGGGRHPGKQVMIEFTLSEFMDFVS